MILMAKSETRTIQGQHALVNSVCRSTGPRQNDFAISIKNDEEPTPFTLVGNSADSPEPLSRPSSATDHDAEMLEV
jgi:hypothetical protein